MHPQQLLNSLPKAYSYVLHNLVVDIDAHNAIDSIRHLYLALSLCVISHVIVSVVISLMYSQVMQRQV